MDSELQKATDEVIAKVQSIVDKNATKEKQTAEKIRELFGTPSDTASALASLRSVVVGLAERVTALEAAATAPGGK